MTYDQAKRACRFGTAVRREGDKVVAEILPRGDLYSRSLCGCYVPVELAWLWDDWEPFEMKDVIEGVAALEEKPSTHSQAAREFLKPYLLTMWAREKCHD